ncbi:MAG TPA: arylesterase [Ferrovibrio sp.]|uniref:arylesterase n=1 Tax=Ferrovibrio sp. TaxID=1917215 RepID=UPI002B4B8978|nr:arylesterase [Ferrovibrio sp.]HLT77038.1 arylesterase [Ferrovibrio sp.]
MMQVHAGYGPFRRWRNAALALAVMLVTLAAHGVLAAPLRILALGDSLTAGYNLPADASFPAQLEKALREKGVQAQVINAGVSGDTTAGGLARLDWALADRPTHALVALGANDMLRGLPPEEARANLDRIITRLKQENVKVMLVGMLAAPNLGADYGKRFNPIYPDLAKKHDVPLYPFFLDEVANNPKLNLGDGIHPNREGVATMVRKMLPQILGFLGA